MISEKAAKLPPFYVMEVLERAKELESMGKDIIHLEIGEPDFPTAPHICEAASFALTKGETKYTHSQGLLELREAIARHYYVKFKLDPDPARILVTSGTKAILINSPCNPTGHVMSPENLRGISEIAGNIPVISDEIYQGLIYQGKDHSILEYTSNAFVLNGFSKLYAMTGWRLGYLIAPKEYIRALRKIQQNFFICANSFVQHAGIGALTGPQDQVREMVATMQKNSARIPWT